MATTEIHTPRAATAVNATATAGKVGMWVFLATEVMFFTGLIGSYIVLRSGSPPGSYSNLYAPGTPLDGLAESHGVVLLGGGSNPKAVAEAVARASGMDAESAGELVEGTHHAPQVVQAGLSSDAADALKAGLENLGASARVDPLRASPWPRPYHSEVNPLSIDLTALNTFILICSSVTMVLALQAIQRGQRSKLTLYLLATVLIGGTFLSIQVFEYSKLAFQDFQPLGVSADHHFRPSSSLFASCFFTMTGFHGAHVLAGLLTLLCILAQSLRGVYTAAHHAAVEVAGLYWHFVDLVWIVLFTIVYLI
ncbi:MAG: cytochrome c oxidase subunit 3 [Isosphaeraceae bacterium]